MSGFAKKLMTGLAIAAGQVLHTAHRPDLPGLQNQDPSGTFGDPADPPITLVILGDSSVTAPGVEPLDSAWPRQTAARLAEYGRHVDMISVAVGGSKVEDVLAAQLDAALAYAPDMAIVSVGANDALRATPVARFERDMHVLVGTLVDRVDQVGLSGVGNLGVIPRLPRFAAAYATVRSRSFNQSIQRVARAYDLPKSSTWGERWHPFAHGDPAEIYTQDRFHASAAGHHIFSEAMIPVIDHMARRHGLTLNGREGRSESSQ